MSLLVQKYGGTSVGSIERIKQVAAKIVAAKRARHDIVVVVSAMAGETNRLLALAHEIAEIPDEREKDVLLASGEQVSVALLTLALKELGQPARSYLGHQVRIETDNAYGKARILSIDSTKIVQAMNEGDVVVVAGFQGVDEDDNITTLGRGGSDTTRGGAGGVLSTPTACEIYTDVDGVFTADPANLSAGEQARAHFLRRDDRAGEHRREGAADSLGRVCQETTPCRCTCARRFQTPRELGWLTRRRA